MKGVAICVAGVVFCLAGFFAAPVTSSARDQDRAINVHKDHDAMARQQAALSARVKVEEKTGRKIALDTRFYDENGREIRMADLFDKPVVLLPIYFFCPSICTFLQADLAEVLNKVDQVPGRDFNVVSLSFSDDETHEHAGEAKENYTQLIERDFPLESWVYLTGTRENIRSVTDSIGFQFIKQEKHLYVHPNVLVVLAADGTITRYIYGPNFLPFDVGMALAEAGRGETGISIKRGVLSFCFSYDSEKKRYALNVFRIAGTAVTAFLIGFVLLLIFYPRKERRKGADRERWEP